MPVSISGWCRIPGSGKLARWDSSFTEVKSEEHLDSIINNIGLAMGEEFPGFKGTILLSIESRKDPVLQSA